MTDSKNIKAFECCEANGGQSPQCDACPYHYTDEKNDPCYIEVRREILKILNNERSQIKSLEAKIVIQKGLIDHQQAEIERLQEEKAKLDNTILYDLEQVNKIVKKAKAEAGKKVFEATINKFLTIKGHYVSIDGEFVEVESPELLDELENLFGIELCEFNEDYEDSLNTLVKEMVGEESV